MSDDAAFLGRFPSPVGSRAPWCDSSRVTKGRVEPESPHAERTAATTEREEEEASYECPLCSLVCPDGTTLQEHVDLHWEYGSAEEQRSREREARQEAQQAAWQETPQVVEHKAAGPGKTQLFGLSGYRSRYHNQKKRGGQKKQEAVKASSTASRGGGLLVDFHHNSRNWTTMAIDDDDDGRTRTRGVTGALFEHYRRRSGGDEEKAGEDGLLSRVWLCAKADHFCTSDLDRGWGCGYRNVQTLLSSLLRMRSFTGRLRSLQSEGKNMAAVPSIPRLQALIEAAWREGLDPQGASHFQGCGRLRGGRAWIGATEVHVLLTSLGVRARVLDFHQATDPGGTHPRLFDWVKSYFSSSAGGDAGTASPSPPLLVPRATSLPDLRGGPISGQRRSLVKHVNLWSSLGGGGAQEVRGYTPLSTPTGEHNNTHHPRVTQTSRPPLYLQHQGHSRSVVGVEERRDGTLSLLLLDPGCPAAARELLWPGCTAGRGGGAAARAVGRMRKLPGQLKHPQYQLVAVEEGAPLSAEERRTCVLRSKTWRAQRIP